MTDKQERIKNILLEYKDKPNKDLVEAMDYLQNDFEKTKEAILTLTKHLDGTEKAYFEIYDEYKRRTDK